MPASSQNSWLLHGHVPSVQKRAPRGQHVFKLKSFFGDFTSIWVGLYSFYLFYLIHNSKGHKHLGLFCTKLQVLWFPTLVILLIKLEISLFFTEFICKTSLSNPINVILFHFPCIFRALWLVTSWATGHPYPLSPYPWYCKVYVHMER